MSRLSVRRYRPSVRDEYPGAPGRAAHLKGLLQRLLVIHIRLHNLDAPLRELLRRLALGVPRHGAHLPPGRLAHDVHDAATLGARGARNRDDLGHDVIRLLLSALTSVRIEVENGGRVAARHSLVRDATIQEIRGVRINHELVSCCGETTQILG